MPKWGWRAFCSCWPPLCAPSLSCSLPPSLCHCLRTSLSLVGIEIPICPSTTTQPETTTNFNLFSILRAPKSSISRVLAYNDSRSSLHTFSTVSSSPSSPSRESRGTCVPHVFSRDDRILTCAVILRTSAQADDASILSPKVLRRLCRMSISTCQSQQLQNSTEAPD